jgi:hypothetical protein
VSVRKLRFDENLPDQEQVIQMGDTKYRLRSWWNSRTLKWMLDVSTEAGEPIIWGDALTNGSAPGSNCLDFPVTLFCSAPEVQKMSDLWDGRLRVYYIPEE